LRGAAAQTALILILVTSGLGIPLRLYLLSAAAFDYQRLGEKFARIFLLVFALDQLWGLSPFLVFREIGFGGAFAATAALLYVPFAERTLLRMAYPNVKASGH
jgi:cholera toxin transcriptional activator